MAEAIRMPTMSDTMTEGVIVEWHKKVGDTIKSGDILADVETDKATMPLESYQEGTLLHIAAEKGASVPLNEIVAVIGKKGEDYKSVLEDGGKERKAEAKSDTKQADTKDEAKQASPTEQKKGGDKPKGVMEIRMPLLSDTMTEGKIAKWNKKPGDKVKSDDALADVETDKATLELIGYEEGTLLAILVPEGEAAPINDIVALVGPAGTDVAGYVEALKSQPQEQQPAADADQRADETPEAKEAAATPETVNTDDKSSEADDSSRVKASPLARRMATEKGIDLQNVKGTGDGGRIVKRDIEEYKPAEKPAQAEATAADGGLHLHSFDQVGKEGHEDIPNSQMRKTIARRLSESKFQAPHFYLTMEINMDQAITARKAMNELSPVKISFNDLVIKACAMALREHPAVNSSWMGDFIRKNQHVHIGSAVAMPDGLIVPVIRFADQKSLSQIAADAKELYDKARNKKLQPNEFSGNTFTISNLGMMDIDEFTAIINPPDSAILAVGKIKEVVVKKGDGFGVTNVMKVTLSCDHRSVDGASGAAFLQTVKAFLESPVRMLI